MNKAIILIIILTCLCNVVFGGESRPKIGLVLSGGGARGAAHIGVIEALEEMNVPIDFVVGTSMGAVIGALYASGIPINQIKKDFSTFEWDKIFSYDIPRDELYFRRKLDNDIFIITNFINYSKGKIHLPYGLITGQSLYQTFNSYLLPIQPIRNFNSLPIPFKAVSTDLVSGKPVILDQGDLALAMLASMAVPGIISPIDMNGYLLVDGGVSCNLPIEVAKEMGADILIVVDVGTPMSTKNQITDLAGVIGQITNILTNKNIVQSKSFLDKRDILLKPNVQIKTDDFDKFNQGILPGRVAAYQHKIKLEKLVYPDVKTTGVPRRKNLQLIGGELKDAPLLSEETYHYYLNFDPNYISTENIEDHIEYLYGLNIFERIYYGIDEREEGRYLFVKPKLSDPHPIFVQASMLLDTDFQTTNNFSLVLGVTNPQMNSLLGEWRVISQIGYGEGLFAEYYQPFTSDLLWFVNPTIGIQRIPVNLYFDYDPIAEYLETVFQLNVSLGRNFLNWGRMRAFWQYEFDDFKLRTGSPFLPQGHERDGEIGLNFEWDTLDNLYFPHHGFKGNIIFSSNDELYGGDNSFKQLILGNLAAFTLGKHSLVLLTQYNRTLDEAADFANKFTLGGLFKLTGLANNELFGNNSGLISAIYFYQIKKLDIIPNRPLPLYIGTSFEAGKVWGETNLSNNRFEESVSIFAGADTILGPIYLAIAATDSGRKAAHLVLRPPFK